MLLARRRIHSPGIRRKIMAQPTATTTKVTRVHPLLIGAVYGLVAAVLQYVVVIINHTALSSPNGILGFAGGILVPLIAVYLSGHYAGHHQRMTGLKTDQPTLGLRSTFSGSGAGLTSGVLFVILTQIFSAYVSPALAKVSAFSKLSSPSNQFGALSTVIGGATLILGIIGWLFMGLILGSLGGAIGDGLAHRQLLEAEKAK
jgi:hypothetical protein